MITIEEKLNVFNKLVLEKVQQEFEEKRQIIAAQNNERIEAFQAKLEKESKKIIDHLVNKGKIEKNKMITKANLDKKRKILHKKQEFIERVIEDLKQKAYAFTKQEEYRIFLKKSLEKIYAQFKEENVMTLYLTKKDMQKHKTWILQQAKALGYHEKRINLATKPEEMIGGLIAVNQSNTVKIDFSIASIIKEHEKLIGQRVYDALKKAGDACE